MVMALPDVTDPEPPSVSTRVSVLEVHADEATVTLLKPEAADTDGLVAITPPAAFQPVMTTVIVSPDVSKYEPDESVKVHPTVSVVDEAPGLESEKAGMTAVLRVAPTFTEMSLTWLPVLPQR